MEGMLAKDADIGKLHRRRARVMERARDLARSGEHADHTSIIRHLESLGEFAAVRERFEWSAFRTQLDRLCAMARGTGTPQVGRPARRAGQST